MAESESGVYAGENSGRAMKQRHGKPARHERWTQGNGAGVLQIGGVDFPPFGGNTPEIALLVNGAPLIIDFHDGGSIGRFAFLVNDAQPQSVAEVERRAASGFVDEAPLSEQIAPLLALMDNGNYTLTLAPLDSETVVCSFDEYDSKTGRSMWYYPWSFPRDGYNHRSPVLLLTQWEISFFDEIIERYVVAINRGEYPALISVGAKDVPARFLLDGHHKMAAYRKCGKAPVVLHIEAEQMSALSPELTIDKNQSSDELLRCLEKQATSH